MQDDIESRLRQATRKLQTNPIAQRNENTTQSSALQTERTKPPRRIAPKRLRSFIAKRTLTRVVIAIVVTGAVTTCGFYGYALLTKPANPIPLNVRQDLSFDTYYPLINKLPSGYKIDASSFSATAQALIYTVTTENDQQIVIAIQKKPPSIQLDTFYRKQLTSKRDMQTSIGTAAIATVNGQTFASLPTNTNAWLILTAPKDIDSSKFTTLLQSLRKS